MELEPGRMLDALLEAMKIQSERSRHYWDEIQAEIQALDPEFTGTGLSYNIVHRHFTPLTFTGDQGQLIRAKEKELRELKAQYRKENERRATSRQDDGAGGEGRG